MSSLNLPLPAPRHAGRNVHPDDIARRLERARLLLSASCDALIEVEPLVPEAGPLPTILTGSWSGRVGLWTATTSPSCRWLEQPGPLSQGGGPFHKRTTVMNSDDDLCRVAADWNMDTSERLLEAVRKR
jgi:hypothetical protein